MIESAAKNDSRFMPLTTMARSRQATRRVTRFRGPPCASQLLTARLTTPRASRGSSHAPLAEPEQESIHPPNDADHLLSLDVVFVPAFVAHDEQSAATVRSEDYPASPGPAISNGVRSRARDSNPTAFCRVHLHHNRTSPKHDSAIIKAPTPIPYPRNARSPKNFLIPFLPSSNHQSVPSTIHHVVRRRPPIKSK